ncbi:hypothetical protein BUW94_10080, partial [Corynebacterium diphtheriae]
LRRPPSRLLSVPENNIAEVKQKPFTPPTVSPTELTTYIGTPPRKGGTSHQICSNGRFGSDLV